MSSPSWQDRRFMWQKGKEIHQPNRKLSTSSSDKAAADAAQNATTAEKTSFVKPNTTDNPFIKKSSVSGDTTTTSSQPLRDRHFIWSKGKEVHEPAGERRRSSASSQTGSGILGTMFGTRTGSDAGTGERRPS